MKIQNIREIKKPPKEIWTEGFQKTESYSSNDHNRMAWFTFKGEVSMGVSNYSIRIGKSNSHFDELQDIKIQGYEKRFIDCPEIYQPWTYDNRSVIVIFDKKRPILLEADTNRIREIQINDRWASIALCSHRIPYAFIYCSRVSLLRLFKNIGTAFLIPMDKELKPSMEFAIPSNGPVFASWLEDGGQLLVLCQEPKYRTVLLQIYDPKESRQVAELDISSELTGALNIERTKKLKKSASLKVGEMYRSMSAFYEWGPVCYDKKARKMYLCLTVPTDDLRKDKIIGWFYPAGFKWVEIELNFNN